MYIFLSFLEIKMNGVTNGKSKHSSGGNLEEIRRFFRERRSMMQVIKVRRIRELVNPKKRKLFNIRKFFYLRCPVIGCLVIRV